jgi:hypothetical protein
MKRLLLLLLGALVLAGNTPGQDKDALEKALAELKQIGAKIEIDLKEKTKPIVGVDFAGTEVLDPQLVHLKALPDLKKVGLRATKISDNGLEHLKELVQLKQLDLRKCKISDNGLEHLQ